MFTVTADHEASEHVVFTGETELAAEPGGTVYVYVESEGGYEVAELSVDKPGYVSGEIWYNAADGYVAIEGVSGSLSLIVKATAVPTPAPVPAPAPAPVSAPAQGGGGTALPEPSSPVAPEVEPAPEPEPSTAESEPASESNPGTKPIAPVAESPIDKVVDTVSAAKDDAKATKPVSSAKPSSRPKVSNDRSVTRTLAVFAAETESAAASENPAPTGDRVASENRVSVQDIAGDDIPLAASSGNTDDQPTTFPYLALATLLALFASVVYRLKRFHA